MVAHVLLTLAFGGVVGLALGLVGGGGSILTVPLLVYALGESVHLATGTALAIVGANALIGAWDHGRGGCVRLRTALVFGGTGIAGALAGSYLNHLASGRAILLGFAALMLAAAMAMVRVRLGERAGRGVTAGLSPRTVGAGLAVGLLTGFFGVGGGFLIVPALVLVLGLPMREAVGTSLLVIAIDAAAALLGHLQGGVDWGVAALFIAGGTAGSLLGSRLSGRLDERRLRLGFAGMVVLVALYIIGRTLLGQGAASPHPTTSWTSWRTPCSFDSSTPISWPRRAISSAASGRGRRSSSTQPATSTSTSTWRPARACASRR